MKLLNIFLFFLLGLLLVLLGVFFKLQNNDFLKYSLIIIGLVIQLFALIQFVKKMYQIYINEKNK